MIEPLKEGLHVLMWEDKHITLLTFKIKVKEEVFIIMPSMSRNL